MVWNPNFPLQTTNINQSTPQIQTNWAFIANSVGTDHFFDTGAPDEGHHRYVQYANQGADPAVAIDSVLYSKSVGLTLRNQLFFKNPSNTMQIPKCFTFTGNLVANSDNLVLELTNMPPGFGVLTSFVGLFIINLQAASSINGAAIVYYNGGTDLTVIALTDQGGINNIKARFIGLNAFIDVVTGGGGVGPFQATLIIMET